MSQLVFSNIGGICTGGNRKPRREGFVNSTHRRAERRKQMERMEENRKRAALTPRQIVGQIANPSPFF